MAGIDMSKLNKKHVDAEETTTIPSSKVSVEMPVRSTPAQPQNSSEVFVSPVFRAGMSVGSKAVSPLLVSSAIQVIRTALDVYQHVKAEKELTKRYEAWTKMKTATFIAAERGKTARVHEVEETKRAQIEHDSKVRHHELYNELKKMERSCQNKERELELQRTEMEHMYQTLNNMLNAALEAHKECRTAYFASNCNNAELKEQLNRTEERINQFMTQYFQYLQSKNGVRSE